MKTFRKVYVYNPENPVYSSSTAKTYQCLNNETGDKRLIIINHLKDIPVVQLHGNVLQPIEQPTRDQPFSVYNICNCVSQIGKIQQHDAMYLLKCLLQSPQKSPTYCIVSPQGICTSMVQGLLPQPSPKLFELAIGLIDVPSNLGTTSRTIVSKECMAILRGLRDGESVLSSVNILGGWKDKKEQVKDSEFWVFRGRRKEEGIMGEEYGLAWKPKLGLVRFKPIDINKGDVDRSNMQDYMKKTQFMMENDNKKLNLLKVYKCQEDPKMVKLFVQNPNQGALNDYISKRKQLNMFVSEEQFFPILQRFVETMRQLLPTLRPHTTLHIKYLYMDYNTLLLGQPLLISDRSQKKLRQLRNSMDYFAPQLKQNIIIRQNVQRLDQQKIDIWSFGFILHKIFMFELPIFDPSRKPIIKDTRMSSGLVSLISSCLRLNPSERPRWSDIDFSRIKREKKEEVVVSTVIEENQERQEIRLGSRKEATRQKTVSVVEERKVTSPKKSESPRKITEAALEPYKKESSELRLKDDSREEENLFDVEKEMMVERPVTPVNIIPQQLSSRLKKIKLIFKIIIVLIMYLAIFFGPFLGGTVDILSTRGFLKPTTLFSLDSNNTIQSSVTVLTNHPEYFLLNDISFGAVQDKYHCINNQFDPIYNPNFSLNSYIQTNEFVGVMISGWAFIVLVCLVKGFMIWNAGISNKTEKSDWRYWFIYGFAELGLAALLYAHFYLYEFFYFSKVTPCFAIDSYNGIEPYFDSILYLFLKNVPGYFTKVFTTMCLFSLFIYGSLMYYATCTKSDVKNFFGVFSIVFRVVPWLAFLIICRIGVFKLYAPTAIQDPLTMLPSLLNNSFKGFIGVVPQIFIIMCICVQLLLELIFYYCEKNAAKSDLLNRLFNTDKKKVTNSLDGAEPIPQDSLVMSKNQLDLSDIHND